ncbi:pilus assembly protein PilM [Metasolibacillus meyeri]|uniref:Pilus assembly protein PilM n=1 Tax=Metasolibacillus meyeri TaxID=1071052 RepID=A0AAW9NXJ5_9BACL|nr:pilus assembly protein PilM [Metasolibacillus meyeri]MEC1179243.1 pilus assembly protein PilM [Metasolibacillus meyeri]
MFKLKKKSHVAIELNDYILRVLVKKGEQLAQWETHDILLAQGIVQDSVIVDEVALFKLIKDNVALFGGKKQLVRTFVPDTSVLLKTFEHPQDVEGSKLKPYVQMELGRTVHLPFHEPLIDVYDPIEGDGQATLFAAPSEEVMKLVNLLLDAPLTPEAIDIRALCNLRLLEQMEKLQNNKTYMITNWLINELTVCIYSNGHVDFLRFQTIDTDLTKWHGVADSQNEVMFSYTGEEDDYRMLLIDQVMELDRIMNFFRFSLHKGEKMIDEVVVMGDNPWLSTISELIAESLPVVISTVNDKVIQQHYPNMKAKYAALIGLALKEVHA